MAKSSQSKKKRSSANPRSYSSIYKDDRTTADEPKSVSAAAVGDSVPVGGKGSNTVDWKNDYAYVVGDLRQLAIVSVVLFALIIAVGLLI